jgi:exodeoxyribonuclease-1
MKAADPEQALYSGRFFGDDDRRRIAQVRRTPPGELADLQPRFRDPRLPDLLFRFRARNYAETLSEAETEEWEAFRTRRLTDPEGGGSITLDAYFRRIRELRTEPQAASKQDLLDELEAWGRKVSPRSTAAAP